MRKFIFILFISIFAIFTCVAQPNPGFENWHTEFTFQEPDSWQTYNFLSLTSPPNALSATKATGLDKHSGNYALKIKTIFVSNNPYPNLFADTSAFTFTGKVIFSPPSYKMGFPYSGRPEKLEFWSKYFPVGNDTGGVAVVLNKWNGVSHDTIAKGTLAINATLAYTLFQLSLTYYSNELPDSASIVFAPSKSRNDARINSTIYVDDVAFTGWVGIDEQSPDSDKIKIFPNPAKDNVTIQAQIDDACTIKVFDVSGKQLGEYKIQNYIVNINTASFAEGIYFYEIADKKERVLTSGKFNVLK